MGDFCGTKIKFWTQIIEKINHFDYLYFVTATQNFITFPQRKCWKYFVVGNEMKWLKWETFNRFCSVNFLWKFFWKHDFIFLREKIVGEKFFFGKKNCQGKISLGKNFISYRKFPRRTFPDKLNVFFISSRAGKIFWLLHCVIFPEQ